MKQIRKFRSQKKVYYKVCVLFAGFVRGVEENCMSQAGEGSLHPEAWEIALGQKFIIDFI